MKLLGYALLILAAAGAHLCVLRPALPERLLLAILSVFRPRRRHEVFVPYFEIVEEA